MNSQTFSYTLPFATLASMRARLNTRTRHFYNPLGKELVSLRCAIAQIWGDKSFLLGAVGLGCTIYRPMPKSWSKKRLNEFDGERIIVKPDADNLLKFLMDAMSGVVYSDDAQVYINHHGVHKFWAREGKTVVRLTGLVGSDTTLPLSAPSTAPEQYVFPLNVNSCAAAVADAHDLSSQRSAAL